MFFSLDNLSLDTAGTPLQAIDSKSVSPDSMDMEATFAEVMKTPLLAGDAEVPYLAGEELPVGGRSLPLAVDPERLPDQGLIASSDETEQIVAAIAGIETAHEVTGEAVVPLARVIPDPSLAELDDAIPATITDVATNRAADSEKPSGIHNLRPGADPFVRQAIATDRGVMSGVEHPVAGRGNELDMARDHERMTPLRPVMSTSQDATPRPHNSLAPEVPISTIPVSTGTTESTEMVQKPGIAAVSSANSAAIIQAPQTQQFATAAPKAPAVLATSIDVPVLDESWGNALQDRVMWMTTRNIHNAEIRLNPAELGPIRVQVSVQDDAAQLTFTAQHALTREAIEVAMPRLREMLGENGLSLGEATVSDGDSADVHKDSQAPEHAASESGEVDHDDATEIESTSLRRISSSALLDTFA